MVEYRHMTVNGAVNYAYDDRYVATFSFAADGSDNYRPGNRWGFYPSLGLGWIVSRERFLRDSRMVDLLKLRASVGKNGWDPMGEMRYLWEATIPAAAASIRETPSTRGTGERRCPTSRTPMFLPKRA